MSGPHPGPEFEGPSSGDEFDRQLRDFAGPAAPEPEFLPCYRHADRNTGITCQRCHRPICMACMTEATVGFQCPDCSGTAAKEQPKRPRQLGRPATAGGSRRGGSGGPGLLQRMQVRATPVTWSIAGISAVVMLANFLTGGRVTGLLALSSLAVEYGQVWRLLTFAVTTVGLFGLALNALVLVLVGRTLEPLLGGWRFAAIFLTSTLVGGVLFVAVTSGPAGVTGMQAGVLGLIAANAAIKLRAGADIRGDLILLGIMVVFAFVVGFGSTYWLTQLGGVIGGGAAGLIVAFVPSRQRRQLAAIGGVWLLCAIVLAASVAQR
ncbi:rhomboid family intramembrane serine protease [Propionibacteriaceae bacterium Y2011]